LNGPDARESEPSKDAGFIAEQTNDVARLTSMVCERMDVVDCSSTGLSIEPASVTFGGLAASPLWSTTVNVRMAEEEEDEEEEDEDDEEDEEDLEEEELDDEDFDDEDFDDEDFDDDDDFDDEDDDDEGDDDDAADDDEDY
jgi:hypothetical protein